MTRQTVTLRAATPLRAAVAAIAISVGAALAGCTGGDAGAAFESLEALTKIPDFSLTDQDGDPFGSPELYGKIWVALFVYTRCPGPCPKLVQDAKNLRTRLGAIGEHPDLHWVAISADPEHDSPEVLRAYAKRQAVDADNWQWLTGPREKVEALIRRGFMVALSDNPDPTSSAGPIIHSLRMILVDGDGKVRGYYDSRDAEDTEELKRHIISGLAAHKD